MDFTLTDVQRSWIVKARELVRDLPQQATAADVVLAAARQGLVDPATDLLSAAVAAEAIAAESGAAALAYALHTGVVLATARLSSGTKASGLDALISGERAGAIALSSEDIPTATDGRLSGKASWVAPLTNSGLVLVGARAGGSARSDAPAKGGTAAPPIACLASLGADGVSFTPVATAALEGLVCGHVVFADVPCTTLGDPAPIMACVRVLLAAAGLGMGDRAVREALVAARAFNRTGAGGEQTVQGLVADAATEIDAARLLTWKAASNPDWSLAEASMAKLASTEAAQRAVARASQVIGGDALRRGHVIERLSQDVRALELFAGRTEALREAVAAEVLG